MLIRDDGASWTAITQPAHAFLAGQIAARWAPEPGPDVVLAVEQHDVAWVAWDRTPPLHRPAGRPASFYEAPPGPRLEIWRGVTARLDAQSPYAALLVGLHARNIHTRYARPENRPHAFLDDVEAECAALRALLRDVTDEQTERDADLLFAIDALSLALCLGWEACDLPPADGVPIRLTPGPAGTATLHPWPLAVPDLDVAVHARRLTARFDDEAAMHRALAATPHHREVWHLRPA